MERDKDRLRTIEQRGQRRGGLAQFDHSLEANSLIEGTGLRTMSLTRSLDVRVADEANQEDIDDSSGTSGSLTNSVKVEN